MKIIYYSGSGNTRKMGTLIREGIEAGGKCAELISVEEVKAVDIMNEEVIILGCPAVGVEELDEEYIEPLVTALSDKISGKKVALFGSYGWGDGEWMRTWEERMKSYGAELVAEGLIIQEEPKNEDVEVCRAFGTLIAKA